METNMTPGAQRLGRLLNPATSEESWGVASWAGSQDMVTDPLVDPANWDDDDDGEYIAHCPACGQPIDYCQGHGEIGDYAGWCILNDHDNGEHFGCDPRGCDDA